ncbi:growth inhibitor PemK [Streptococcus uberis]|uniref:growth inhibitor PemK n=1 Tax=Streptococcus uberis TaxID=1349 RepID=UPI0012B55942|nr:growth inhibitor PemK [Streptococcus uberis]MTB62011.1 growth inhibitor PemK [Streptococcus uberis]MTB92086.1 growth inhibitor PemK [Streptococcus uberis]MTC89536.1 growth inhibitor PemK [Streptococcus uberis]
MVFDKTKEEIGLYTAETIDFFERYLHSLILSKDDSYKKAGKIDFWVENWTNYLKREVHFKPSLPALRRGSIIYADFGFNVGREYGGLHYAIVLNKIDSRDNHLLHVLPLSSAKPHDDLSKLPYFKLDLGNEIYRLATNKGHQRITEVDKKILELEVKEKENNKMSKGIDESLAQNRQLLDDLTKLAETTGNENNNQNIIEQTIENITQTNKKLYSDLEIYRVRSEEIRNLKKDLTPILSDTRKMLEKISKMKKGSLAILNQVTTISKMRIYDPQNKDSLLFDIVLSETTMDRIDEALKKIY